MMADVLAETVAWSQEAGMSEIFDNRSFVVRMMQWAHEQQRWDDVDEIGRRLVGILEARGVRSANPAMGFPMEMFTVLFAVPLAAV